MDLLSQRLLSLLDRQPNPTSLVVVVYDMMSAAGLSEYRTDECTSSVLGGELRWDFDKGCWRYEHPEFGSDWLKIGLEGRNPVGGAGTSMGVAFVYDPHNVSHRIAYDMFLEELQTGLRLVRPPLAA